MVQDNSVHNKQIEKFKLQKFIDQQFVEKLQQDTLNNLQGFNKNFSKCKIGAECGSCALSYLPYNLQIKAKLEYVKQLMKLLNVDNSILQKMQIISSVPNTHYRGRMDYAVNYEGFLGLKKRGSWYEIVPNHTCFLALPVIEQVFYLLNKIMPKYVHGYDRLAKKGFVSFVVIRGSLLKEFSVNFVIRQDILDKLTDLEKASNLNAVFNVVKELQHEISVQKLDIKFKGASIAITNSKREESVGQVVISIFSEAGEATKVLENDEALDNPENIDSISNQVQKTLKVYVNQKADLYFSENVMRYLDDNIYMTKLEKTIYIHEVIHGVTYKIGSFSFFQPNHYTAGLLQKEVASVIVNILQNRLLKDKLFDKEFHILDLFGGQGFLGGFVHYVINQDFSFYTSTRKSIKLPIKTTIIDIDDVSIQLGKQVWNTAIQLSENIRRYKQAKTNHVLKEQNTDDFGLHFKIADAYDLELPQDIDVLILDPPRRGLTKRLIKRIKQIKKLQYIVYVSCNVKQFALEYKAHFQDMFEIQYVKLIDQFPHTYHVESVILMTKRG